MWFDLLDCKGQSRIGMLHQTSLSVLGDPGSRIDDHPCDFSDSLISFSAQILKSKKEEVVMAGLRQDSFPLPNINLP